jgi:hypothetical protein
MDSRPGEVAESELKDKIRAVDEADLALMVGTTDESLPFGNAFPNRFTKGINRPIWKKDDGQKS